MRAHSNACINKSINHNSLWSVAACGRKFLLLWLTQHSVFKNSISRWWFDKTKCLLSLVENVTQCPFQFHIPNIYSHLACKPLIIGAEWSALRQGPYTTIKRSSAWKMFSKHENNHERLCLITLMPTLAHAHTLHINGNFFFLLFSLFRMLRVSLILNKQLTLILNKLDWIIFRLKNGSVCTWTDKWLETTYISCKTSGNSVSFR